MDDLIHAVPAATGMTGTLRHPLEPLSAAEIRAVMAVIHASADFGPAFLFETVELKEPPRTAIPLRASTRSTPATSVFAPVVVPSSSNRTTLIAPTAAGAPVSVAASSRTI